MKRIINILLMLTFIVTLSLLAACTQNKPAEVLEREYIPSEASEPESQQESEPESEPEPESELEQEPEPQLERINLYELLNQDTGRFEDIRHLLGELIELRSEPNYEIMGGGGMLHTYIFESGVEVFFISDSLFWYEVDFEQTGDKTRFHFNGIDGTSTRDDVIERFGQPTWEHISFYNYNVDSGDDRPIYDFGFAFDDDLMVTRILFSRFIT